MTDEDGFRIEAAEQYGFVPIDDDCEHYWCTESQLLAFAKACERAGRAQAAKLARDTAVLFRNTNPELSQVVAALNGLAEQLDAMNAAADAALRAVRAT